MCQMEKEGGGARCEGEEVEGGARVTEEEVGGGLRQAMTIILISSVLDSDRSTSSLSKSSFNSNMEEVADLGLEHYFIFHLGFEHNTATPRIRM